MTTTIVIYPDSDRRRRGENIEIGGDRWLFTMVANVACTQCGYSIDRVVLVGLKWVDLPIEAIQGLVPTIRGDRRDKSKWLVELDVA